MSNRRDAPNIEGLHSVKVDNLSYNTNMHDLKRMFDRYGDIGDVYIPRDRRSNMSRGFGFVRFHKRKDAEYAVSRVDGRSINGREVRCSLAKYDRPIDERERERKHRRRDRSHSPRRRSRSPRSRSPRHKKSRSRSPRRKSPSSTPGRSSTSTSRSPVAARRQSSRSRSADS